MVTQIFHLCHAHACWLSGYVYDQHDYKANTYRLDHPESIAILISKIRYSKHWLFILLAWARGMEQPSQAL